MSELAVEPGAVEAAAEPAAPAAEPVDALANGDAAGAATDGAVAEPAAPAVEGQQFDPAEYEARLEYMQAQQQQLLAALEQANGGQSQQQPGGAPGMPDLSGLVDEFGGLNPEGLVQLFALQQQATLQAIDQRFQQFSQPFEQQRQAQEYDSGLESAKDMLGDNIAQHGEFASQPAADKIARDRVLDRADTLLTTPEFQSRYGQGPRAAEIAIAHAAQEERDYLASVRGQGAEQATNRLSTLAGAAGEPGSVANGAVAGQPAFASRSEMLAHYAAEARRIGPPDTNDPRY